MGVDFSGTKRGTSGAAGVVEPKMQHLKCRKDGCKSIQALEMAPAANITGSGVPHHRTYMCVECKTVWTMSVGGFVNL